MSILQSYYRQMRHAAFQPQGLYDESSPSAELELSDIVLGSRSRAELACILEEFGNRPLTQRNYVELQRELRAAELMPDQLFGIGEEQQRRGNIYMSRIVQSWQKMTSRGRL